MLERQGGSRSEAEAGVRGGSVDRYLVSVDFSIGLGRIRSVR